MSKLLLFLEKFAPKTKITPVNVSKLCDLGEICSENPNNPRKRGQTFAFWGKFCSENRSNPRKRVQPCVFWKNLLRKPNNRRERVLTFRDFPESDKNQRKNEEF